MQDFFKVIFNVVSVYAHSEIFTIILVFVVAFVIFAIARKLIKVTLNKILRRLDQGEKSVLLYYILKHARLNLLSLFSFIVAFYFLSENVSVFQKGFSKLSLLLFIGIITSSISGIMEGLIRYTEVDERFHGKPYRSFAQVVMILVYIAVAIISICIITEKSPTALLAGFGAITAVIALMFNETILSFVSSVQISAYDLIRTGDWIEITSANIDGEVVEVSLHAIKVKNWDNSISSISTNNLLKVSFKNWRNMQESNARRVRRSIQLDASSIKFVDETLKQQLENFSVLGDYFNSISKTCDFSDDVNKSHITNLEAFKVYALKYLENISDLRKDMTLLVRTYEVSECGIMLEVYGFSFKTSFADCEKILGKVLQDFLATLKYFDLKPFQIAIKA